MIARLQAQLSWKKRKKRGLWPAGPAAALLLCCAVGAAPRGLQEAEDPNQACFECHGDSSLAEEAETRRLYVEAEAYSNSVHSIFSCTDCHQDLAGRDPVGHDPDLLKVDCGMCHPDAQEAYAGSLHAYALERGNPRAPGCANCHGKHDILAVSDQRSPAYRMNVPDLCASCHGEAGLLTDQLVKLPQAVRSYARSVHGQAFQRGIETAATCTDCHGIHDLAGRGDPDSRINPLNVSSTCGVCHAEARAQYEQSIHGRALRAGIADSPTCNNCHGEHLVLSPQNPQSATSTNHVASQTCGRCHQDSKITEKYGLANYVVSTYVDSYHGWATRWASEEAASCVSCHTAHWVLPARDPKSTINSGNVAATCRQCHPNANEAFAASYTHRTASVEAHPVTRWIRYLYWVLIPSVIGVMLLHNGLILTYFMMEKHRAEKAAGEVLRLDRVQVVQHTLLGISFIGLVITGFALRFPDAWWVSGLTALGMNESARSLLHRLLAIVMLGVGISHLTYITASRRGRREFRGLIPRRRDLRDARQTVLLHLGKRREKVPYGRYDYTQKLEYWALVWGTAVMALSGFVLWFPANAVRLFPSWIVEASQAVHYYEAWLAGLAVVVWHFFFVLLHPAVYPMSWTWLTGKMTLQEVRESHPEWYQEEFAPKKKAAKAKDAGS